MQIPQTRALSAQIGFPLGGLFACHPPNRINRLRTPHQRPNNLLSRFDGPSERDWRIKIDLFAELKGRQNGWSFSSLQEIPSFSLRR
jgi:hypothetical protein